VALGVLSLATLLLLFTHRQEAALFTGLFALIAAAAVIVRRFGGAGDRPPIGQRLGKGPHVSKPCPTNNDFVDKLAKVVVQLREAATEENWSIDWTRFNTFDSRAINDFSATCRRLRPRRRGEVLVLSTGGKGVPLVREDAAKVPAFETANKRPGNRRMASAMRPYLPQVVCRISRRSSRPNDRRQPVPALPWRLRAGCGRSQSPPKPATNSHRDLRKIGCDGSFTSGFGP
jgi:hypothetical protein